MDKKNIIIKTDFIRLDQLLKWTNSVVSGSEAKLLIEEGKIKVNQEIEYRRGRKIFPGDLVDLDQNFLFYIEKDKEVKNLDVPK